MILKVAMPGKIQFKIIRRDPGFLLPGQGDIHYIGGAEVLPPPLEADKESEIIGDLGTEYEDEGDVICAAPNESFDVFGMQVRTLRSNDQGVAYLLHGEGKTIYHAGDLNWWHWEGESETFNKMIRRTYQSEINKLQNEKIDVAFVPVDPRLGEQYGWGIDCFMKRTDTKCVFPMHFWGNYEVFDRLMLENCTEAYRDRIMKIGQEGQTFLLES